MMKKDSELEKRWLANTKGLKIHMISQYIVIGPEGAALQVDREKFIDQIKSLLLSHHKCLGE